jgi:DNA-binding CsgD family transcriptional regulator
MLLKMLGMMSIIVPEITAYHGCDCESNWLVLNCSYFKMSKSPVFNKLKAIWHNQQFNHPSNPLQFDHELYRSMMGLFGVGRFYYYIFDVEKLAFVYFSDEFFEITGHQASKFGLEDFLACIHPEDSAFYVNCQNAIGEMLVKKVSADELYYYKVSLDFRFRHAAGHYLRVLQQTMSLRQEDSGAQRFTFGIHTDITALKHDLQPVFSIIGLEGRPSYYNIQPNQVFQSDRQQILSKRELEVARLLAKGLNTHEIAGNLSLSELTIATHRKNMLKKVGVSNTAGLVNYLINQGLG